MPEATAPTSANAEEGMTLNSITKSLANSTKAPLIVGGLAMAGAVVAMTMWASAPTFKPLYTNLAEVDGGAIISELEKRGVDYKIGSNGTSISVPSDDVYRVRLQLAEQGLPEGGDNGFEIIDQQRFGISQFNEQVNFQRAMEGELARSISALGPVSKARVHLALAKPSVFARQKETSKASVIVTLQPGRTLSEAQSNAIAHMVSSSIPELQTENVSIVDQDGRLIGKTDEAGLTTERLAYIKSIESDYIQRIEKILDPIFGAENFQVQITADIDFNRQEETSEQFSPNQGLNASAAIRSAQLRARASDTEVDIGGITGALSNTPPGWAPAVIDNGPNNSMNNNGFATNMGQADAGNVDVANTVNYEVDRSITHTKRQPGAIVRISAAVLINHRESLNEEGEIIRTPVPVAELADIEALVQRAIGFSPLRGDDLRIVNTLFAKDDEAVNPQPKQWYENTDLMELIDNVARYLFVFLAGLIMYFVVLKPLIKRDKDGKKIIQTADGESLEVVDFDEDGKPIYSKSNGEGGESNIALDASGALNIDSFNNDLANSYETALEEAKNLSKNDPQIVALAIKDWINKED